MVVAPRANLESCKGLHRGHMLGGDFKSGAVRVERLTGAPRPLQRQGQVEARVRVSGHQLRRELELARGFVEPALPEEDHAKVLLDPVSETEEAAMAGDPAALAALAANPNLDGSVATLGTEESQSGGTGGGGGPPAGSVLNREYVWGPGDRGVDELLVQYDINRAPTWPLQDAGLDAIALCDLGGPTDPTFPNGTGRMLWQATYDTYGSVLTTEAFVGGQIPHLRAGHKGLFFDRLDVAVVNPSTGYEQPRLAPTAKLVGYERNRSLVCDVGRHAQRDLNATGVILLTSVMQGLALSGEMSPFDLATLYGNGANVYQYLGSSPWGRSDPLGLSWDPFDMVDDYLIEDAASKAAFLERVIGSVHTAAYVTTWLASWIPGPIGIIAGVANGMMGVPSSLEGTAALSIMSATEKVALGVNMGRFASSLLRAGTHYARHHGTRSATGVLSSNGVARRINTWAGDHHIIPVYMRGLPGGTTYPLTHAQHVEIHNLIDRCGAPYGIPPRAGRTGGTARVTAWVNAHPDIGPTQMRAALIEAYSTFDGRHGTNLTALFFNEVMNQQWLP